MTYFLDGPAAGQKLQLKRTPIFLRVVVSKRGKWDALDGEGDTPKPDERIYAYRIWNCDGTKLFTKAGAFPKAEYAFLDTQPPDAEMRTNEAWHQWAAMEGDRIGRNVCRVENGQMISKL